MATVGHEPDQGGDRDRAEAGRDGAEDGKAGRDVPFDEFLRSLYPAAKARNDTEWLEWYEGWLRDMPEDDREGYMERSRAEYERRAEEAAAKFMRQKFGGRTAAIAARLAAKNRAENLAERRAELAAERRAENLAESQAEAAKRLSEDARKNIEDATNEQIMVGNFKMFRREYMEMWARRSC